MISSLVAFADGGGATKGLDSTQYLLYGFTASKGSLKKV